MVQYIYMKDNTRMSKIGDIIFVEKGKDGWYHVFNEEMKYIFKSTWESNSMKYLFKTYEPFSKYRERMINEVLE